MDMLTKENLEKIIQDSEYMFQDSKVPMAKRIAALDLNVAASALKIILLREEINNSKE